MKIVFSKSCEHVDLKISVNDGLGTLLKHCICNIKCKPTLENLAQIHVAIANTHITHVKQF